MLSRDYRVVNSMEISVRSDQEFSIFLNILPVILTLTDFLADFRRSILDYLDRIE